MSAWAVTVICCDGCHQMIEMSSPSLRERMTGYRPTEARILLSREGWKSKRGHDLCPECAKRKK